MGLRPVTYWQAVCDACDKNLTDDALSGYSAWAQEFAALEEVFDRGGHAGTELVLCGDCRAEYLSSCPDDEWEALADEKDDAVARAVMWAHLRSTARSKA